MVFILVFEIKNDAFDCCFDPDRVLFQANDIGIQASGEMIFNSKDYGTIFVIGISRISSAPDALSFGISWLTAFFGTTVWML